MDHISAIRRWGLALPPRFDSLGVPIVRLTFIFSKLCLLLLLSWKMWTSCPTGRLGWRHVGLGDVIKVRLSSVTRTGEFPCMRAIYFLKFKNMQQRSCAAMWHLDPDIFWINGSYIHVPSKEEINCLFLVWRYFPIKFGLLIEPKLAEKYVQSKKIEWAVIGNSDQVRTESLRIRHISEYKHPLPWIKGIYWILVDVDPVLIPHWMLNLTQERIKFCEVIWVIQ